METQDKIADERAEQTDRLRRAEQEANAIKYIWRADLKSNDIEDLKKAAWYIQREIQRRQTQ